MVNQLGSLGSFNKVKDELTSPPVLAWYNPAAETKITGDASAYGLGAVLHTVVWEIFDGKNISWVRVLLSMMLSTHEKYLHE